MSMLSAQCDELRSMAESVGLAVPQAATLMMEAADTIWELRGALQVASVDYRHLQAERDRLREELADAPKCETCEAMLDCDECLRADGSHKERRRLSAENAKLRELLLDVADLLEENAKLRELVRDMYKAFMHGNCYRWCEFKEPCNYISDGKCQWYDRMRELGVDE